MPYVGKGKGKGPALLQFQRYLLNEGYSDGTVYQYTAMVRGVLRITPGMDPAKLYGVYATRTRSTQRILRTAWRRFQKYAEAAGKASAVPPIDHIEAAFPDDIRAAYIVLWRLTHVNVSNFVLLTWNDFAQHDSGSWFLFAVGGAVEDRARRLAVDAGIMLSLIRAWAEPPDAAAPIMVVVPGGTTSLTTKVAGKLLSTVSYDAARNTVFADAVPTDTEKLDANREAANAAAEAAPFDDGLAALLESAGVTNEDLEADSAHDVDIATQLDAIAYSSFAPGEAPEDVAAAAEALVAEEAEEAAPQTPDLASLLPTPGG